MGPERIVFGADALWYGAPQWQIEAFWRFQIPEEMAKKYGYPQLSQADKRKILGLNSAHLYKLPSTVGAFKAVPTDYEKRIPDSLKTTLNFPGYSRPGSDRGDSASRIGGAITGGFGHDLDRCCCRAPGRPSALPGGPSLPDLLSRLGGLAGATGRQVGQTA